MSTDDETTPDHLETWDGGHVFLPVEEATPEQHPALYNLSAGHLFGGVIRPIVPDPPEYVALDVRDRDLQVVAEVAQWNMLWEAGQFRRRFFDQDDLPEPIASIADMGDINTILVPRTATRFFEYEPLFHLLPKATLSRFGLPLLRRGLWPYQADWSGIEQFLPEDFEDRLARAWAWTVWPRINSGSGLNAFSRDDPIKLLAHNLDFWVPPITDVIESALRELPEVDKGREVGPVILEDGSALEGAVTGNPRMGGYAWVGEEWADEVVRETVDLADQTGRLRDIIDAVRSHRLEDDFSTRWSYAREDFERKLHRKRNRVQVRFVELTETIPVQGSESDFADRVVTNDFMALLDREQREVVVLLASGLRQHEVAEKLGYANHGAISKKLSRIRKQAEHYFELD
ncbi:hypothetical protein ASD11_14210 [Aeromicrobium sp. Root495]|nr:hypothetical protein ASD11_14210 [Aeromicrobium sp. Root495]